MTEQITPAGLHQPQEESPLWSYQLRIGNFVVSEVEAGKVTYDADGSASFDGLIFDDGELEGRALHRRLDIHVQQKRAGKRDPWHHVFSGEVKHANTDENGITELEAFGPRALLRRKSFVQRVTYQGVRFDTFIQSIADRLKGKNVRVDIRGGARFVIDKRQYQGEANLGEAVDQVAESAINIVADRPGYVLLVAPTPRPGVNSTEERILEIGPRDYAPRALKTPEKSDGPYGMVGAFKRDQEGNNTVEAFARVRGRGRDADADEIYWIPEFSGTQEQAAQQTYVMARALEQGQYEPKVKTVLFQRPIFTFMPARLVQERRIRGEVRLITYDCVVQRSTLDLADGSYDLVFDALRSRVEKRRERYEADRISPYILTRRDILKGDDNTLADIGGLTIDEIGEQTIEELS